MWKIESIIYSVTQGLHYEVVMGRISLSHKCHFCYRIRELFPSCSLGPYDWLVPIFALAPSSGDCTGKTSSTVPKNAAGWISKLGWQ